MVFITSCSKNKNLHTIDTDKAFLSLSKGRSSGGCPVYDIWIFEAGKVVYNGIENVRKSGIHELMISKDDVNKISDLVTSVDENDIGRTRGRDNPLTMLRYKNKKMVYQNSYINGRLRELNNFLEQIKDGI